MENKVSVWKANLNTGIILGLMGIVWTLFLWFIDQSMNQTLGYVFFIVLIVGLVLGIRSYREKYRKGFLTYGQSLGAGVVIMLYYSIIAAVFTYIMFTIIDPSMPEKILAATEQKLIDRGMAESIIEQSMKMQSKIMVPWVLSLGTLLNGIVMGTIFSLIISIFTRKEGNPLIDEGIEE